MITSLFTARPILVGVIFLVLSALDFGFGAGFSQGSPLPGAAFYLLLIMFPLGIALIAFGSVRAGWRALTGARRDHSVAPNEAPHTPVTVDGDRRPSPAPTLKRMLAYVIDVLGLCLAFAAGELALHMLAGPGVVASVESVAPWWVPTLIVGYFAASSLAYGPSAKARFGLAVVARRGGSLGLGRALVRGIGLTVESVALGIVALTLMGFVVAGQWTVALMVAILMVILIAVLVRFAPHDGLARAMVVRSQSLSPSPSVAPTR